MADLAVIIVSWNNAAVISQALRSLIDDLESSPLQGEIWVVDSASSDGTAALIKRRFPSVKLLACRDNIGFARANNLGMRRLGFVKDAKAADLPAAVYLLNPDTITHQGATEALHQALFSRADIGWVGARLRYADGSFQHSAFMFPGLRQIYCEFFPTPGRFREGAFNGRYPRSLYHGGRPFAVDFTLGATMMLKREAILQTGGFDEGFFMYCEEVDWALRMRAAGWKIFCVPRARLTHIGGGSSSQVAPRSLLNLWRSRLLLAEKHFPPWKRWLARQLIMRGMQRRLDSMSRSEGEMADACAKVIELARA